MLPVSLAFAWTLWRRHRWGFVLSSCYFLGAVALSSVLLANLAPTALNASVFLLTMTITWVAMYLLAVFSYGFDADVNAGESCFPADLLRLPVHTSALVVWPMAGGAATGVLLWLATERFILRPWLALWDLAAPVWWPAMLVMAFVAWMQALLWLPIGLRGIRSLLGAIIIAVFVCAAKVSVAWGASELFLIGLFAALAVLAWMAAFVGVTLSRRGEAPDWEAVLRPLRQLARWLPQRRHAFASATQAQVWFEWQRTGTMLPIVTGIWSTIVLLPLFLGKSDNFSIPMLLSGALLVPVFFAGIVGAAMGGTDQRHKDRGGVAPFIATLPMTSAALVGAKLKAAALSTLAAWAVLAIGMPVLATLSGNLHELIDWGRNGSQRHGAFTHIVLSLAVITLLIVWTWKRMVDSLLLGLTGRKWISQCAIYATMTGYVGVWMFFAWFASNPNYEDTILALLPWLLGALLLGRILATRWALRQALQRGLLTGSTVRRWVAGWLLLAAALFVVLAAFMPERVPVYYYAFAVLFLFPMVRLALTPLVLEWNRHR